jgi:hypothetical protein
MCVERLSSKGHMSLTYRLREGWMSMEMLRYIIGIGLPVKYQLRLSKKFANSSANHMYPNNSSRAISN